MYFTYEVFTSSAFRDLKPAARDILMQAYFEIKMTSRRSRQSKYSQAVINRHDIKLTYQEIKARLGYSDKTIWSSFKQILGNGFLKVIKHGGGAKGNYQVYGIAEDWRKWEPGQVVREIRKNGKAGWQRPNRISGSVGKAPRCSVGKAPPAEFAGGLPVGKAV